jgi:hypothetical protein
VHLIEYLEGEHLAGALVLDFLDLRAASAARFLHRQGLNISTVARDPQAISSPTSKSWIVAARRDMTDLERDELIGRLSGRVGSCPAHHFPTGNPFPAEIRRGSDTGALVLNVEHAAAGTGRHYSLQAIVPGTSVLQASLGEAT